MKTLILFYSFTGKTRGLANKKADELGADILEVKESRKRGVFNAYTAGSLQAMKQKRLILIIWKLILIFMKKSLF